MKKQVAGFLETFKRKIESLCVRACARACVRVCVRACERERARVCKSRGGEKTQMS